MSTLTGDTAMLVAHCLDHASFCRKQSIGWSWAGKWSAQDWKDSAREQIALARRIRMSGSNVKMPPKGATHTYLRKDGKLTWAKSYRTDGMRFQAKLWQESDQSWGGSTKIILARLHPLLDASA